MKSLTFFLAILLLAMGCDDDDALGLSYDCNESPDATNCDNARFMNADQLRERIQGDWRVLATGCGNCVDGIFCEAVPEGTTFTFSFNADGTYTYTLPSGEMGMANYTVSDTPCLACGPIIEYEPNDVAFVPFLAFFCGDEDAFHDDRPVDGTFGVYRRE